MNTLIGAIIVVVLVTNGQSQGSLIRPNDYIYAKKLQNENNVRNYDNQINALKKRYNERIDTINIQLDMLINVLEQNEARLYPLGLLTESNNRCVRQQRPNLPNVATTKSAISSCISKAISSLDSILINPLNTRNNLENFYTNVYDEDVATCGNKYDILSSNHTQCITTLAESANSHSASNQNIFATQMDTAECTANANIKNALDCSFRIFNSTIYQMSEANILIDKCMSSESPSEIPSEIPSKIPSQIPSKSYNESINESLSSNEIVPHSCINCGHTFSCSSITYLSKRELDYTNKTIPNPFYGVDSNVHCIMLQIY